MGSVKVSVLFLNELSGHPVVCVCIRMHLYITRIHVLPSTQTDPPTYIFPPVCIGFLRALQKACDITGKGGIFNII